MKDWILDAGLDELALHLEDEGDIAMTVSGDLREIYEDDTTEEQTPIYSGMTVRTPDGVGRVVSNTYIDQDDGMESCMVAVSGEWNAKAYNTQDLEVIYVGMDRVSGKPYADNETPCTADEAVEIIEDMRREVFGTVEQMAQGCANELGLEVEA